MIRNSYRRIASLTYQLETIIEAEEDHHPSSSSSSSSSTSSSSILPPTCLEMIFDDSDEQYTPPLNPITLPSLLLHLPIPSQQQKNRLQPAAKDIDMEKDSSPHSTDSDKETIDRSPDTSSINLYGFHRLSLDLFPLCPGLYNAFIRGDEFETSLSTTLMLCVKLRELKNRLFNKQSNKILRLSIANLKFKAEHIQINKLHISEICSMCLEITQLMSYVDPLFRHTLDQKCLQSYLNMIIQIIVSIEQRLKQLLKRNGCRLVKMSPSQDLGSAEHDSSPTGAGGYSAPASSNGKDKPLPYHSSSLRNGAIAHHPYRRKHKPLPGPCIRCHATDTPEWRKGPDGERNLCNACGLKYKKGLAKQRKRESEAMSIHKVTNNNATNINNTSNSRGQQVPSLERSPVGSQQTSLKVMA